MKRIITALVIAAFAVASMQAAPKKVSGTSKSYFEVTTPDGGFFHVDIKYAVAFFEKKTSPTGGSILFCNKKIKTVKNSDNAPDCKWLSFTFDKTNYNATVTTIEDDTEYFVHILDFATSLDEAALCRDYVALKITMKVNKNRTYCIINIDGKAPDGTQYKVHYTGSPAKVAYYIPTWGPDFNYR
ncbi:MAG: hypothetical protein IK120_05800 [Muribaculaceae bacterium]|nr:hypothetical protein [Muribaculaceae bacterium]MBR5744026.1 hypothetical protein [Muribaculaceae bacterium]